MPPTLPEDDLIAHLAGRPGSGTYEAHITVEVPDRTDQERFHALCNDLGVKCVVIELSEGTTPIQPMTAGYHRGPLAEVAREVAALVARVRAGGFPVSRVKVEAVATNDDVPTTDDEARTASPTCYFEFHVKLLLPADADLDVVRELCRRHGARLSRNALKAHADGRRERFATLRVYGAGRDRAFGALDRLCDDLAAAGYEIASKLREYSLYDSRVSLDAGWMDGPPA